MTPRRRSRERPRPSPRSAFWTTARSSGRPWQTSSGHWTFTSPTTTDGDHSFIAKVGKVASTSLNVKIDTHAPDAPTIGAVSGASPIQGGADAPTNVNTLHLTGTGEASSLISVFDGTTLVGTAKADGSGNWSFTSGTLIDGDHNFTATATDVAGNSSLASSAFFVTVDTTPPQPPTIASIDDDTGAAGDGITTDNTLTLSGTVNEPGSTIQILDGGVSLGTAIADELGRWSFDTATLSEGDHTFTAIATDLAGNVGNASTVFTVSVVAVEPVVPVMTGFGSDTGTVGDGLTADQTLHLTGTAAPNSVVAVYDGANALGNATADANGDWTFDTAALGDGAHSLTAKTTGNGPHVSSTPLVVTVDATAPNAPVIVGAGTDTGTPGDFVTSDTTLHLTGTSEALAVVTVLDGVTVLGTATADGSGNWSFDTLALGDAVHTFTAKATDAAGNTGLASNPRPVTVDTQAPSAPSIATMSTDTGLPNDHITSDDTLHLTGTAEKFATVSLYDGVSLLGQATADGLGNWTFDTTTLSSGDHNLTATATDIAGNTGVASGAFTVTIDKTAPNAPVITGYGDDTGVPSDGITSDTDLHLTGTSEANATVTVSDGATVLGTAVADGAGAWSFDTGILTQATHSLTATATDVAGNKGTASTPLVVTVDTTAPPAPTLTGYSTDTGVPGDGTTADNAIALTGTATAGTTVDVFEGATLLGTAVVSGGTWTFDTGVLADGVHVFTTKAVDAAGNLSGASSPLTVNIDTTAPSAPDIDTANGLVHDATPTVVGSAEKGSTVTLVEGDLVYGTAVTDSVTGLWSITVPDPLKLADGIHILNVTATDAAGNTSDTSIVALHVDEGLPPTATLTIADDTIVASPEDSVIAGTAFTLNPGDSLDGGDGYDVLELSGPGTFDLSALQGFTDYEKVSISNFAGGTTDLTVGSGPFLAIEIDNADGGVVNLGSGPVSAVTLGSNFQFVLSYGQASIDFSASENSSVVVGHATLAIDDRFVGNADGSTFIVTGDGEYDFTWADLGGKWNMQLGSDQVVYIDRSTAAHLVGVTGVSRRRTEHRRLGARSHPRPGHRRHHDHQRQRNRHHLHRRRCRDRHARPRGSGERFARRRRLLLHGRRA